MKNDIFLSIVNNKIDELKALLIYEDINTLNLKNQSLLHYAILYNQNEIFHYLIDNGISIETKDINGYTPIILCVRNNQIGYLKTLIRLGADLTSQDNFGEDAMFHAFKLDRTNLIELLLETIKLDYSILNSNDENINFAIVRSQNIDLFNTFFNNKLVNSTNCFGQSLLHTSVKMGCYSITKCLLEERAFANIQSNTNETPLFYAVRNADIKIIRLLLSYGAIIELQNNYDETIFDTANSSDLKSYLEDYVKSDKYLKYVKYFPLHYFIIIGDDIQISNNLNAANINRKDPYGFLPIDIALLSRNQKVLNIIKKTIRS